ncbi:hypothetical protein HaLaN_08747 [Haematococcus lacustris]|uniref:Uncharacterized protein n=1 Tax=Haematococcus lacustris TaxID=44745 RepID=A0A699YT17_HAELA|nr:hypothetical protein HaLaN_08747 [Haematococcus lacustris]
MEDAQGKVVIEGVVEARSLGDLGDCQSACGTSAMTPPWNGKELRRPMVGIQPLSEGEEKINRVWEKRINEALRSNAGMAWMRPIGSDL